MPFAEGGLHSESAHQTQSEAAVQTTMVEKACYRLRYPASWMILTKVDCSCESGKTYVKVHFRLEISHARQFLLLLRLTHFHCGTYLPVNYDFLVLTPSPGGKFRAAIRPVSVGACSPLEFGAD